MGTVDGVLTEADASSVPSLGVDAGGHGCEQRNEEIDRDSIARGR